MTVRRTITLTDWGARLLDLATGGNKARGGGDYLSDVLRQRQEALARAMQTLGTRWAPGDVLAVLMAWEGLSVQPMTAMDTDALIRAAVRSLGQSKNLQIELDIECLCTVVLEVRASHAQATKWIYSKGD